MEEGDGREGQRDAMGNGLDQWALKMEERAHDSRDAGSPKKLEKVRKQIFS